MTRSLMWSTTEPNPLRIPSKMMHKRWLRAASDAMGFFMPSRSRPNAHRNMLRSKESRRVGRLICRRDVAGYVSLCRRSSRLSGQEPQPHVVRSPLAFVVTQRRPQSFGDFIQERRAFFFRYAFRERNCERFQPSSHSSWKWCRARNQRDIFNVEACAVEPFTIIIESREIPRDKRRGIRYPISFQCCAKSYCDGSDASVATHFCRETSTRFESAMSALDHGIGVVLHPVHGSVRENGVELEIESEGISIHDSRIESSTFCG